MPLPVETLADEVLRLSPADRSRLLDQVVASLDADKTRNAAWDALAAHREAEITSGASTLVSGPEVLAKLRGELE